MKSKRETLLRMMKREECGPVVLDLGSSPNTSITKIAYENLVRYLGLKTISEPRIFHKPFQLVEMDGEVLSALHIDTRAIGGPSTEQSRMHNLPNGRFSDEWGIIWRPAHSGDQLLYYEVEASPLIIGTEAEIDHHPWPEPANTSWIHGLRKRTTAVREQQGTILVGHHGDTSIFENARDVRGMVSFLMDLIRNKDYAHKLLDKVTEIQCAKMEAYLGEVGDLLDVVCIGDDLGGQEQPLISPALYREMIKPYHERYFDTIKSHTTAMLHMHSCGSIQCFLDDLIEIGVDIINPVQVTARGMDPEKLKTQFGERITFWGGIDSQHILPQGTPEDVRKAVRHAVKVLSPGGGYILSAVHNIQSDVPPENIVAMFDEANKLNKTWG